MREAPNNAVPFLYGPDDVTEGYYELEIRERGVTRQSLHAHRTAVELWYRCLTLYRRSMMDSWTYPGEDGTDNELAAWGLQSQLLGLGVSSAKGGLDVLLAGYYSLAFAAIRHMVETIIQHLYITERPLTAANWYQVDPGHEARQKRTSFFEMVQVIKKSACLAVPDGIVENLYVSWKLMSKGSHPSGEGIVQTLGPRPDQFVFGPNYNFELAFMGFEHGLSALVALVRFSSSSRALDERWVYMIEEVRSEIMAWRIDPQHGIRQ